MTYTDFAGSNVTPPLVAGSLYGLRTFRVEPDGMLSAVSWPYVWTNGENIAECHQTSRNTISIFSSGNRFAPVSETFAAVDKPHDIATCMSHGFYAYTDTGPNTFHIDEVYVQGMIEGYGVVHEGTRGFRAEKAKIVGLVYPEIYEDIPVVVPKETRRKKLKDYRDNLSTKGRITYSALSWATWLTSLFLMGPASTPGKVACAFGIAGALFLFFMSMGSSLNTFKGDSVNDQVFKQMNGISRKDAGEAIKETYTDAKIFKNTQQMIDYFEFDKKKNQTTKEKD